MAERKHRIQIFFAELVFCVLLASCTPGISPVQATLTAVHKSNNLMKIGAQPDAAVTPTPKLTRTTVPTRETATPRPSRTPTASPDVKNTKTSTPTKPLTPAAPTDTREPRQTAKYWASWPQIPPYVSDSMKEVYRRGLDMGNDPHAFSAIGDCQSAPSVFMGIYDTDRYVLWQGYEYLQETIEQFQGSFSRDSKAVVDGLSVASVLSPDWADPEVCLKGESPLECEFRLHKPSIVFINLGTNWRGGNDITHAAYLREIVEAAIAHGVVPVISSKGDNEEGDHRLNRSMAQVAYEYDLPFWNFWRAIRHLPDKGLDTTRPGGYLSVEAWGPRSFSGLRALDAVWRDLRDEP
jgi:hypothetical protein